MKKIKPLHIMQIGLGVDMLMHGLVRIPNLPAFVAHSTSSFKTSFLPDTLVTPFLYVLPFIEAIIGILILVGGKTRRLGFIAGGLIITVLLFGTATHQAWDLASQQLIYLVAFAVALMFHDSESAGTSLPAQL